MSVAVWRLKAGGPFRSDLMLRAAMTAGRTATFPWLSVSHELLSRRTGASIAALLIGQLHWYQKRPARGGFLSSVRDSTGGDQCQKAQLASARIEVLDLGMNDAEAALKVAEMAEISIADEAYRDQIAAERARILGRGGHNRSRGRDRSTADRPGNRAHLDFSVLRGGDLDGGKRGNASRGWKQWSWATLPIDPRRATSWLPAGASPVAGMWRVGPCRVPRRCLAAWQR